MALRMAREEPYRARLWRGPNLLIETYHYGVASLQAEVMAMSGRVAKRDATRIEVKKPDGPWHNWEPGRLIPGNY
jgi:hypothetical protein